MMSDLLDGIVGQVVPPFTLAKLEGDAAFAFAADGATFRAPMRCLGPFKIPQYAARI